MAIAGLPTYYTMKYSDKDGQPTSEYNLYNDQLSQVLQEITSKLNTGNFMPYKTDAEAVLARDDANVPVGSMWFNTTQLKMQFKTIIGTPGTIETITSA